MQFEVWMAQAHPSTPTVATRVVWMHFPVFVDKQNFNCEPNSYIYHTPGGLNSQHKSIYLFVIDLTKHICHCHSVSVSRAVCSYIPSGCVWTQLSDTFVLLCGSAGVIVDWLICCDTLLPARQSQGSRGGTMVACRNAIFTTGWICLFYSPLPQVPWICHVGSWWYEACWLQSCRQQGDIQPVPSS